MNMDRRTDSNRDRSKEDIVKDRIGDEVEDRYSGKTESETLIGTTGRREKLRTDRGL